MWDIVMVAVGVVSFLACAGYVAFCERLRAALEPERVGVAVEETRP